MLSLLAFILALIILITVHEFGHFWVARKMGVKVLRFSLGFGKVLWRKKDHLGTEYVFSAFPLGGYIKMLDEREGDVKPMELQFAFNRKPLFSKIAIVVAGPLANWLFAIFAFWLMFFIGLDSVAPVIGEVKPNSIAERAGITKGDEILAVGDLKTDNLLLVRYALVKAADERSVQVDLRDAATGAYKETTLVLDDVSSDILRGQILEKLGMKPYLPQLPAEIADVMPNGPADRAGIEAGDRVVSVDDNEISYWQDLVSYVQTHPGQTLTIRVEREGRVIPFEITPFTAQPGGVPQIGVISTKVDWPEEMKRHQHFAIHIALGLAFEETIKITQYTFAALYKMVTGQISVANITGPIGIAKGAGSTARYGFVYYLGFLALVSISLAILNILPIPVLDGGHLVYHLIEAVRGKPLSDKAYTLGSMMTKGKKLRLPLNYPGGPLPHRVLEITYRYLLFRARV